MANGKKISEQPIADSLSGNELIPFANNGTNGTVAADTIKEYAQGGLDDKYADKSDTYTKTEVDGLVDGAKSTAEATYAKKEDVPTKVSELENDANYQTESDVDGKMADKVDKEDGKGLSSNDFTDDDKEKLDGIDELISEKTSAYFIDGFNLSDFDDHVNDSFYATDSSLHDKLLDAYKKGYKFVEFYNNSSIVRAQITSALEDKDLGTVEWIEISFVLAGDTFTIYARYDVYNLITFTFRNGYFERALDRKVDKKDGKGLSTNDYTTDEKDKLGALPTNAELTTTLATKADKTTVNTELAKKADKTAIADMLTKTEASDTYQPKGNYLTSHQSLADYAKTATMNTELAKKVDKVSGKQLSTEDFTTVLKQKLEGLTNYDDTALTTALNTLKGRLDTLVGSDDATAVIDTFQEIEAFLQGVTNTQTLTGLLQEMKSEIVALCASTYIAKPTNGTSSQFLKADGSVDSTAYLPTSGGTVKGGIGALKIKRTGSVAGSGIEYLNDEEQSLGIIGVTGKGSDFSYTPFYRDKDGVTNKLWHEGNFTPSNYLPTSGGTIASSILNCLDLKRVDGNGGSSTISFSNDIDGLLGYIGIGGSAGMYPNSPLFKDSKNNISKIWHERNDGAGSGLDADLLDGKHLNEIVVIKTLSDDADLNTIMPSTYEYYISTKDNNTISNKPEGIKQFSLRVFKASTNNYIQILTDAQTGIIYERYKRPNVDWKPWKQLAFTDSNVASADKLTTKQLTNEDLNDVTTVGTFYYGITANTCTNKPNNVTSFHLEVYGASNTTCSQILTATQTGVTYKRFKVNNSAWSAWKKMLTEDDIASLIPAAPKSVTLTRTDGDDILQSIADKESLAMTSAEWNKVSPLQEGDIIKITTDTTTINDFELKIIKKKTVVIDGTTVDNISVQGTMIYGGTLIPVFGLISKQDSAYFMNFASPML